VVTHIENDIRRSILSSFQDKPKKEIFKVFHFIFEKNYDLNTEEGIKRYRIFKNNLKLIETHNAKNYSYQLGITEFSDLTREEFKKAYLNKIYIKDVSQITEKFLKFENQEIFKMMNEDIIQDKDEVLLMKKHSQSVNYVYDNSYNKNNDNSEKIKIDWTSKLNPPVSQSICKSCWAFAAIGAIEGNYNIAFGHSERFSVQELIDCEKNSLGCDGGFPNLALEYVKNNGIASYKDYPYTSYFGKKDTCKASSFERNRIVESIEECPYPTCTKTQLNSMLQKGPLVVYIDGDGESEAATIFQHYTGGILENLDCKEVNHALIMVGKDYDSVGEYIIGRNSWGNSWGENGNFRIRSREEGGTCFMEKWAALPKIKK
jgi:xylem cysteine proteinase